MVLGLGPAQVDLIRKLSDRFEVHGVGPKDSGPGMNLVDFFHDIDIRDLRRVLQCARDNRVDYVYSVGSDAAMPTVSYVSEHLNLPSFLSFESALICNNKQKLREALTGIAGNIPYQTLGPADFQVGLELPVIIKPVDSQGQRGVISVFDERNLASAIDHARQFSSSKTVIAEKKIIGNEISVNAFLDQGKFSFFEISDRLTWPNVDGGIPKAHVIPASLTELGRQDVAKLCSKTCRKLKIENGPVYFQIIMAGNSPFIVEVAPRLDGCHIWRLIKETHEVDLIDYSLSHLLGESVTKTVSSSEKAGRLEFYCQPPGTVFTEQEPSERAEYFEWYLRKGELVPNVNGRLEKTGFQILLGGGDT